MNEKPATIMRGWDESGMGEAFRLAEGFNKDTDEFIQAQKMNDEGKLFIKFTAKKSTDLAESLLAAQAQRFFNEGDLMGDQVEAQIEHGPDGRAAPLVSEVASDWAAVETELEALDVEEYDDGLVWHEPEYQGMLAALAPQGRAHQQSLEQIFIDETDKTNTQEPAPKRTKR
jgi:hypothetical protein